MPDVEVNVTETAPASVIVEEADGASVSVDLPPASEVVEVSIPGPQGEQGEQGEQGPPGTDAYYVHPQAIPSNLWTVVHNLGKRPSVTIVDSSGNVVIGDVHYIDDDSLGVAFSSAFSGEAYIN